MKMYLIQVSFIHQVCMWELLYRYSAVVIHQKSNSRKIIPADTQTVGFKQNLLIRRAQISSSARIIVQELTQ